MPPERAVATPSPIRVRDKPGSLSKSIDDAGHVLVVTDMFADGNEGDWDEEQGSLAEVSPVKTNRVLSRSSDVWKNFWIIEDRSKSEWGEGVDDRREVNDMEIGILADVPTEDGEEGGDEITSAHAKDEWD